VNVRERFRSTLRSRSIKKKTIVAKIFFAVPGVRRMVLQGLLTFYTGPN
jgi:hypothetical protein